MFEIALPTEHLSTVGSATHRIVRCYFLTASLASVWHELIWLTSIDNNLVGEGAMIRVRNNPGPTPSPRHRSFAQHDAVGSIQAQITQIWISYYTLSSICSNERILRYLLMRSHLFECCIRAWYIFYSSSSSSLLSIWLACVSHRTYIWWILSHSLDFVLLIIICELVYLQGMHPHRSPGLANQFKSRVFR